MELNDVKIVSGGDANYFELLKELALSIRHIPEGKNISIAYLDGGLSHEQIEYFQNLQIQVVDPGWRHPEALKRSSGKEFLKVEIAKVHLDLIFPDDEILIWVDADAWLQTSRAIELYAMVARKNKFAIVSQASRLQKQHLSYKNIFGNWVELRNILFKNARRAGLPKKIVNNMKARPTLNAGVYALRNGAPHWERFRYWQDFILQGKRGRIFTATQLAFGVGVYEENLPYEAMPEICNYMGPYRWDNNRNCFVEFYAPYEPVSIMHLVAQDEMRLDKSIKIEIPDINDELIPKSLRYFNPD